MNRFYPNRQSIRLKGYDYSQPGMYFVTICAYKRQRLFGEVHNDEMVLNEYGEIVLFTWNDLINHNTNIELDTFQIMPNHIHGIIIINDAADNRAGLEPVSNRAGLESVSNRAGLEPAPTDCNPIVRAGSKPARLSEIIRQLKIFSAKRINHSRQSLFPEPVWHRNYYEHIIRNTQSYNNIADYIRTNPQRWAGDCFFQ